MHEDVDLDIGIPLSSSVAFTYFDKLFNWATHERAEAKLEAVPVLDFHGEGCAPLSSHNPAISRVTFKSLDGQGKIMIELVNTQAARFKSQGPPVDFTCSNLRLLRTEAGKAPTLEVKVHVPSVPQTVGMLINDCARHIARELQENGPDKRALRFFFFPSERWHVEYSLSPPPLSSNCVAEYRKMFYIRKWIIRPFGDWASM